MELNKIYNEDCFITLSKIENRFIDLVMTSPPYNMSRTRKGGISDTGRYDVYQDWLTEDEYIDNDGATAKLNQATYSTDLCN